MIASASFGSRRFVSLCVTAAAFLMRMTASTNEANGASWEMGKLRRARSVWMPYSASAGTGSSPSGSRSIRVALIVSGLPPGVGYGRSILMWNVECGMRNRPDYRRGRRPSLAIDLSSAIPHSPFQHSALLGRLHPQAVVEAIEVLRHPDHQL